jgi:DNA-binding transcriptional LysR family regulator
MDRFDAMAVLLAVVDRGGFSAAARALRMPVTTVSRRITDLEDRLSAKLFVRTTRKVSLTEAGVGYVAAARRILSDVEEAEKNAAGEYVEPKGELVITAPIFFGRRHVMPVVEEFLRLHPQITARLILLDRNIPLVEDHIDMAMRIGSLPDSSMIATHIGKLRTVVCASPKFLKVHGVPSTPEMLRSLPCIAFDAPSPSSKWRFHTPDQGLVEVQVNTRLSVSLAEAALDAAVRGFGVARLLQYQVAEAVQTGELTPILESWEIPQAPVHLVHAGRGKLPLKMRLFLDFAAPRLRTILDAIQSRMPVP